VAVKPCRGFVFRINNQCEGSNVRVGGASERIGKKGRAQASPLKARVDCEPTQTYGRNRRVARQFLREIPWKIRQHDTCRSKRVEAGNTASCVSGHETGRDAAPDVLANLLPKVRIEWPDSTSEATTVGRRIEGRDAKHGSLQVFRSLFALENARLRAALGFGGVMRAFANAS